MHNVHIQWAKSTAGGYVTIPLAAWTAQPKKGVAGRVDEVEGLIAHISIRGQMMGEDNVSVEAMGDGSAIMCGWSDNAMSDGSSIAKMVVIGDGTITRKWDVPGGTMAFTGPPQAKTIYCAERYWPAETIYCIDQPVIFLPYADFVPPQEMFTRHGILLPDALWNEHCAIEAPDDVTP